MRVHTIGNYVAQRYNFLKLVEGDVLWAYADSKGIPSIGVGLNLQTHGALVLKALGFDLGGAALQGAARDAERAYAEDLIAIINNSTPFPATLNPFTDSNNAVMQALNPILQLRAQNSVLLNYDPANFTSYDAYANYQFALSSSFRIESPTVSAELLRLVLDDGYTVPGVDGTPVSYNGGYEKLLDTWLTRTGVGAIQPDLMTHNSHERLALLSLAFNSGTYGSNQPGTPWDDRNLPTLLGPKLTNALLNDDRAEAWYEIRYDSNAGASVSSGIANRRYKESNLFNLYNNVPVEEDYKSAYRMFTRHKEVILGSDGEYGGVPGYEDIYPVPTPSAYTIQTELDAARRYLLTTYGQGTEDIAWNHIQVGETLSPGHPTDSDSDTLTGTQYNDLIFGETGLDTINGGAGNDVLYGGAGTDTLLGGDGADHYIGGADNDTLTDTSNDGGADIYYYTTGDGSDTITDGDGNGRINFNSTILTGGKGPKAGTTYASPDGRFTYNWSGTTLTINGVITVKNFSNGNLGIYLDKEDDDPDDPNGPVYDPNAARRRSDPLALDLSGDGIINTVALSNSTTYFDIDADAFAERVGWIAPQDGILVYDRNSNGYVDNSTEVFGDQTTGGFSMLASVADSNGDGAITAADPLFGSLKVWQDSNQDGLSQSTELYALSDYAITAIGTTGIPAGFDSNGNIVAAVGNFTMYGTTRVAAEIDLAVDETLTQHTSLHSINQDAFAQLPADVFKLPWLGGYGQVKALTFAYQDDPGLKQYAQSLIAQGPEALSIGFDQLLARWSGLTTVQQTYGVSRPNGLTVEDRTWILETFSGINVLKPEIEQAYQTRAGVRVNEAYVNTHYEELRSTYFAYFAAQAFLGEALSGTYYSLNNHQLIVHDAAALQQSLATYINGLSSEEGTLFFASVYQQIKADINIDIAALKLAVAQSPYVTLVNSILDGTTGDVAVYRDNYFGDAGNSIVTGNNGNNFFDGGAGNDTLSGGSGYDYLDGGSDNDTLDGGSGNDYLIGGTGNDTYLFGRGYGQDTVIDLDMMPGNLDTVRFAADIAPTDIIVTSNGGDIYLSINGTADRLTLQSWFGIFNRIEQVTFADGTVWDATALAAMAFTPTDGNDFILGTNADDVISSLDGNDQINGLDGNDSLFGGTGNDILYGSDGQDFLDGGSGNDSLHGGTGNDVYRFGRGDGQDRVDSYDPTVGKVDVVEFAADVMPADVIAKRVDNDLVLSINGTTDTLTVEHHFYSDLYGPSSNYSPYTNYSVEELHFADGTVWNTTTINSLMLASTDGNDILRGFNASNDTIDGGAGDDVLYGYAGNDTLDGGAGNDTLDGGVGNDVYRFGRGAGQDLINSYDTASGKIDVVEFAANVLSTDVTVRRFDNDLVVSINGTTDTLRVYNHFYSDLNGPYNNYSVEELRFADGTVLNAADIKTLVFASTDGNDILRGFNASNDTIDGGAGVDILYGYAGNDILDGGTGNDFLDGGAGNDVYRFGRGAGQDSVSQYDNTAGKVDAVEFAADVAPSDVTVRRVHDNLVLSINGTTDTLTVYNHFYSISNVYRVEEVRFADGTVWNTAILNTLVLVPTDGDDILTGFDSNDTINGAGGDDHLYGNAGDDTLDGGTGNDYLDGGTGNDNYLINTHEGWGVISDAGGLDTIYFSADTTPGDVAIRRSFSDLNLVYTNTISGGLENLRLQYWYRGPDYQIEHVIFADGTNWDASFLATIASTPTIGNDDLFGTDGDDVIAGLGGNDNLYGSAGNDTYIFNLGDGIDTVADSSGNDTVQLGPELSPSDITVTRYGNNLTLFVNDTNDRLIIQNWFNNANQVERVTFADGTIWGAPFLASVAEVSSGSEGDDLLFGTEGDDVQGGIGGNDTILGAGGNDILSGGRGIDYLNGGTGNDTLKGGSGDDFLVDPAGDDIYLLGIGSGNDTISDQGGVDSIRISDGVTMQDVTVSRDASSLHLQWNNAQDGIWISSWFSDPDSRIEHVEFADGASWDPATLTAMVVRPVGTEADDVLFASDVSDVMLGFGGDDQLYAGDGSDTLDGGAGDDYLEGGTGDDVMVGSTGSDQIFDVAGNDTYIYNFGDGIDRIFDADGIGQILYRDASGVQYTLTGGARSAPGDGPYIDETGRFVYAIDYSGNITVTLDGQTAFEIQNSIYNPITNHLGVELKRIYAPEITVENGLGAVVRASTRTGGTEANSDSDNASLSADARYVAFSSYATNLVTGDTNNGQDVFLKDTQTGTTTRVSTTTSGAQANGASNDGSLSGDGRSIAFTSAATNLVTGDTNGMQDIFVKNLQTGATTRISTSATGVQGNGLSSQPSMSSDGRYVVFTSESSNLVAGDTNQLTDIFVKDRQTGAITRASATASGAGADGFSHDASLSADGRYVLFVSEATNLVADDTNGMADIFVKDLQTGAIVRVNTANDGTQANDYSDRASMSADGRYVAFLSAAANLALGDPNDFSEDIFVKDLLTGNIVWVSRAQNGDPGDSDSYDPSISADGRYVTFTSYATNLVQRDTNGTSDIFVNDLQTGRMARVSVAADGTEANSAGYSDFSSISADGRYIVFESVVSNLIGQDLNGSSDIYRVSNPLFPAAAVVTNQNVAVVFTGISVQDTDAGSTLVTMTLAVTHGSLALVNATGLTFIDADGSDGALTFSGSLSDLNAALRVGIRYTPSNGYSGGDTLNVVINDHSFGTGLTDDAALAITVVPAITGTVGDDALVGTCNNDTLLGLDGNDVLDGGAGDDLLDGGSGADKMNGGADNDTYIVDNTADVVSESAKSGVDTVQASITYTLTANVENLILTGTNAINGSGNGLANSITGNAAKNNLNGNAGNDTLIGNDGNDTLNGGAGADTMAGGTGNDTYTVDDAGDTVIENAGTDIDLVNSSITYALADNVENLTLTGTAVIDGAGNDLNNVLTGNGAANTLFGGGGNDTLDGKAGTDTMFGGIGDDIYIIDNAGDMIGEYSAEGIDTIQSNITYSVGSNVENLTLTGSTAINGTGNELDNILTGNGAANTLTGNDGNDTLLGGAGVDTLSGGIGNDTLDGGGGNDVMIGGIGDDIYIIGSGTDTLTENLNEGIDTVRSSITHTLGANFENLVLTRTTAINGTGNTLNNVLTGNNANNTLTGNAGNDTLDGSLGTDTLIGGTGNDTYLFNQTYGQDTINENDATVDNQDTALVGVNALDLVLSRSGNNLLLNLHGSTDTLTVQNWYTGTQYQTEVIQAQDGSTLASNQVANLIQAMATFSANNGGISWDQAITQNPNEVQAVLAGYWQAGA